MTKEHELVTFLRARYDEQEAREKGRVTSPSLQETVCPRCMMGIEGWQMSGGADEVKLLPAFEHPQITCDHRLSAEEWKAFLQLHGTPAPDEAVLRRLELNREILKIHQPVWVAYDYPENGEWSCPFCSHADEEGEIFPEPSPCLHLRLLLSEFHGHPELKGYGLG